MNKKVVVLSCVLSILFIGLGAALYVFYPILMSGAGDDGANIPEVRITYENFEEQLMRQSLVQDIPSDGSIVLRFYKPEGEEKTWENSYILRKANVQKGILESADIMISMDSKYLETLTNKNLCGTIVDAKEKGDVRVETGLSQTALAWKYRSMLRYKGCLGLG